MSEAAERTINALMPVPPGDRAGGLWKESESAGSGRGRAAARCPRRSSAAARHGDWTASNSSSTASGTFPAPPPTSAPSAASPSGSCSPALLGLLFVGGVHLVAARVRAGLRRTANWPTRCTRRSSAPPWARAILCFGIGVVALAKKVLPHEVAIQQRHVGMSDRVDRQTLAAQVLDTGDKAGVKRRGMLKGSLAAGRRGLGLAAASSRSSVG